MLDFVKQVFNFIIKKQLAALFMLYSIRRKPGASSDRVLAKKTRVNVTKDTTTTKTEFCVFIYAYIYI